MQKNKLGATELEVTPLTIGAWQLGGPLAFDGKPDGHPDPGKQNVIRMIQELGDLGINAIDTAEQYSDGESERRVGEAIAGHRDQWIVSTKFGYRVGPNNTREDDSSPQTIMPSLHGSLKRLGTDHVDLLLYHCPPNPSQIDEGCAILNQAKDDGLIRAFGISTNDIELLKKLVAANSVEVVQFATSLLQPESALWQLCRGNNLGTQLRGVMDQGRLSGKYFDRSPEFRGDDHRSDRCSNDDYTRYADLARPLPAGMTMAQAAVRWILDQPGAHTICMGAKNMEDYRDAVAAAEMPPLDPMVATRLSELAMNLTQ